MQNIDILENYPKHMPLQCIFIFKPYVQVFMEMPNMQLVAGDFVKIKKHLIF